jgi:hypothetical protein
VETLHWVEAEYGFVSVDVFVDALGEIVGLDDILLSAEEFL